MFKNIGLEEGRHGRSSEYFFLLLFFLGTSFYIAILFQLYFSNYLANTKPMFIEKFIILHEVVEISLDGT